MSSLNGDGVSKWCHGQAHPFRQRNGVYGGIDHSVIHVLRLHISIIVRLPVPLFSIVPIPLLLTETFFFAK